MFDANFMHFDAIFAPSLVLSPPVPGGAPRSSGAPRWGVPARALGSDLPGHRPKLSAPHPGRPDRCGEWIILLIMVNIWLMTVNNYLVDVESGSISICEWMWMMTFSEWMMTKHFCRTKIISRALGVTGTFLSYCR